MKKAIGLTQVFVGVLRFCALNPRDHTGSGIDGLRQTVVLGSGSAGVPAGSAQDPVAPVRSA